ncbi:MAG: anaerobic ribonucleoside-triphosphate reductase activating protein [Oscillospiraceae bacterium]
MPLNTRIAGKVRHSSVDGPGVRFVIFFQGCPHDCPGCQNPDTHDPSGGTETTAEALIEEIKSTRYLDGITLSGGDPMMQPEAAAAIADAAHDMGLNVWSYTGWTFEEIMDGRAGEKAREALSHIDVLVDGRFVSSLKSTECIYRGSTNQRLIDLKKSLASGRAEELEI